MVKGSNNGDGKDYDAMVKKAGAENLGKNISAGEDSDTTFKISRDGKVVGDYKDLSSALEKYVAQVKELMNEKLPYSKPTLVHSKVTGNDGPILS